MHIDLTAFLHWLSQPTLGAFTTCVSFCFLPVLGVPVLPTILRSTLVRGAILSVWARDPRIEKVRQRFEQGGIITEPVTSNDCRCLRCKDGFAMALECDLMRHPRKRPFVGVITRCAACGDTPDLSPGETLDELAARFKLPHAA